MTDEHYTDDARLDSRVTGQRQPPHGTAPFPLISSTDSRTDVPAEMTSSTIKMRPARGAPMITPPSP